MAHAITANVLDHQVEEAVQLISRERARKKALAIGSVVGSVLLLLGATFAMYSYSPGQAAPGQVGTQSMAPFVP